MNKTIYMHKVVNVCVDNETNEAGFELDNKEVIWLYDGIWKDDNSLRYTVIKDTDDNVIGFIKGGFTTVIGESVLILE